MVISTGANISKEAILGNIKKLINQIYKLLPDREENIDWESPLTTIIVEISGMAELLPNEQEILFPLLCKLEGLNKLKGEEDFPIYRKTIFESLNLLSSLREKVLEWQD